MTYIPKAAILSVSVGDASCVAGHVRNVRYRVRGSNVDLLSNFDRIVDLNAEVANSAFDLRMSEK